MGAVAHNGSTVAQSTKNGHVTYKIETYVPPWSNDYGSGGDYWTDAGTGSTNALITHNGVMATSPNVFVNGKAMATLGDAVDDTWIANPSIPTSNNSTRYTATSAISGGGRGKISEGSPNIFCNGKSVAMINSGVESSLKNISKITSGSSNVFAN